MYNKDKPKTKRLGFRVNNNTYDFLKEMSNLTGYEISDIVRKIIMIYFMEYFMREKPDMDLSERYEKTKKVFLEVFTEDVIKGVTN